MEKILPNTVCFEIPLDNSDYIRLSIDLVVSDYNYHNEELAELMNLAISKYINLFN